MELSNMVVHLLETLERPAFVACKGKIVHVNQFAQKYHIQTDMEISELLQSQMPQYQAFERGQLELTLTIGELDHPVSVQKLDGMDLFLMEKESQSAPLQALALASQKLRVPLANLMSVIDETNPSANRALHQLHRIVSNMSDVQRYRMSRKPKLQLVDVAAFMDSLMESIIAREDSLNTKIQYTGLTASLFCMIDEEMLERAILNMISNSVKAESTQIQISLSRKDNLLRLIVKDNGRSDRSIINNKLFSHYEREPGIDDQDTGIGLGMLLIQAAASAHNGAIFVDKQENGLSITMSIAITPGSTSVRSPGLKIDYLGGRDHVLTELSDCLQLSEY